MDFRNIKFTEDNFPKGEITNDIEVEVYIVGEERECADGDISYTCPTVYGDYFMEGTYASHGEMYKEMGYDICGFDALLRRDSVFRFYDYKEAEFYCYQQNKMTYRIKGEKEYNANFKVIRKTLYLKFDANLLNFDLEIHKKESHIFNRSSLIILDKYKNLLATDKNNRHSNENTRWRKKVFERDNYTCQCCGDIAENFNAHHKDGYAWCIEKRLDVENGVTLCEKCHKEFHKIYSRKNNTESQYKEFILRKQKELDKNESKGI